MNIEQNFVAVHERIKAAAQAAHRDTDSIHVVVVTKYQDVATIGQLYDLGVRDFGESRIQDALDKKSRMPPDIKWHFIGTLQTNKVSKAVGQFALIHSVDSLKLATKISTVAQEKVPVLIQVNPLQEASKHGFTLDGLYEAFPELIKLPNIEIRGLMTMAPIYQGDEGPLHQTFSLVQQAFESLRQKYDLPSFTELSMGMSQDFEIAIQYGATIVRIGSALSIAP